MFDNCELPIPIFIFLCKISNAESLAESIIELYEDNKLRKKIANNAFKLYKNRFIPQKIGKNFLNILSELKTHKLQNL